MADRSDATNPTRREPRHEADDHDLVSVDGVMQGWAGRTRIVAAGSSAADGKCRLGTTRPGKYLNQVYQRADAFLLAGGVRIFAGSWGAGQIRARTDRAPLNSRPKYVASTSSPTRNGRTRPSSGRPRGCRR